MRFMRVISLVAGITLLGIGLAALLGRRAEVARERDQRLEANADLVTVEFDAAIARIVAAMAVATPDTPVDLLADALAMPVCAVAEDGAGTCSATSFDLAPDDAVTAALDAAEGQPAPVVFVASLPGSDAPAGVLVAADQGDAHAARRSHAGDGRPARRHVGHAGARPRASRCCAPTPSATRGGTPRRRSSSSRTGRGRCARRRRAAVRLTTDERWLIGAQLAVGAVLAALALGGILADHRSLHRRATTDALTRPGEPSRVRTAGDGGPGAARPRPAHGVPDGDRPRSVQGRQRHRRPRGGRPGARRRGERAPRRRCARRTSSGVGAATSSSCCCPACRTSGPCRERAATIADAIAAAPPIGGYELNASVGAALFPAHGTSLESLLRAADRAMYAAKVQGVAHHLAEPGF